MRFTSSAVAGVVGRNMYPLPTERTWAQVGMSEAKLRISNDRSGGRSTIRIKIRSNNINGQGWEAACVLGGEPTSDTTDFSCYVNGTSGN